jgi:serpin B
MYIKNKYRIKSKFKKLAKEIYKAETESIDFSNKRKAAKKINRWVEKRTKNKIRNLINPKSLNKKTRVILVNSLYFKAQWSIQFDHLLATKKNFYKTDNERIEVEMMHHNQDHRFNYCESSDLNAKFVELPFKGDEALMVIVLPNDTQALARLDDQIDKVLKVDNFTSEPLNVLLPKFRIDARINMKSILKRVGESFGRARE